MFIINTQPPLTDRERELCAIRAMLLRREVAARHAYQHLIRRFGASGIDGSGIYGSGVPHDRPLTRDQATR